VIKQVDEYLMIVPSVRFNSFETAGHVVIVLNIVLTRYTAGSYFGLKMTPSY